MRVVFVVLQAMMGRFAEREGLRQSRERASAFNTRCDATRQYYLHEVGQLQTMSAQPKLGSHSITDDRVQKRHDWSWLR